MNDALSFVPLILFVALIIGLFYIAKKSSASKHPRPDGVQLYGVGGWLAFFVFGLCALWPLIAGARVMTGLLDAIGEPAADILLPRALAAE